MNAGSAGTQSNPGSPVGVLLLQLGTPDAPTPRAVRRYLRQFLSDPRIIEPPPALRRFPRLWRALWWCILNLGILRKRPAQSAEKYRRIWDPITGSPLRYFTERQVEQLQQSLPANCLVRYGMAYGNPAVADAVRDLIAAGVERLIALPLYPQYSATTTASALDSLFAALMKERRVPAVRIVPPYPTHGGYVDAVVRIIQAERARLNWEPDFYLLSFHGIPLRYAQAGDPYSQQVEITSRLIAERLQWPADRWRQTYQSLFGKEEWLRPYTEETLRELAQQGVKRILIAMPGFTADCLETIDEIGREAADAFKQAGGEALHRCPCLNDQADWIAALRDLILTEGRGWIAG